MGIFCAWLEWPFSVPPVMTILPAEPESPLMNCMVSFGKPFTLVHPVPLIPPVLMFAVEGTHGPLLIPTGLLPMHEVLPQIAWRVFSSPAGIPGTGGGGGVAPGGAGGGGVVDVYTAKHLLPDPGGVSTTFVPFFSSEFTAERHASTELHTGEFFMAPPEE